MSLLRKICFGYFAVLLFVSALNYIPGMTDDAGLTFGIFALDIFDDSLHLASALWALVAGLLSHRAARLFLILFGALYLGDGVFGFFTAYGFLDLGIFTNASEGISLTFGRIAANVPHLALGGFALFAGLKWADK